jgi:hypothetical protein
MEVTSWARTLWVLFGLFGTTGIIPYAVLSQSFPVHLSGRANTAVNLLVFIAAFSAQWGIGAIINMWPGSSEGGYAAAGYRAGFAMMLCFQVVSLLWFIATSIRINRNKRR